MSRNLYEYVSMIAERVDKSRRNILCPYMDLACDIKFDLDANKPQFDSDEDFFYHLKEMFYDKDRTYALKVFIKNYKAWLRRNSR